MSTEVIDLTLSDSESSPSYDDAEEHTDRSSQVAELESHTSVDHRDVSDTTTETLALRAILDALSETNLKLALIQIASRDAHFNQILLDNLSDMMQKGRVWEICGRCGEDFDASANDSKACWLHPGDMEPNYDLFADHDEDCHGPIDSDFCRREYPENYVWSCCDEDGTSSGCTSMPHIPHATQKRKRL